MAPDGSRTEALRPVPPTSMANVACFLAVDLVARAPPEPAAADLLPAVPGARLPSVVLLVLRWAVMRAPPELTKSALSHCVSPPPSMSAEVRQRPKRTNAERRLSVVGRDRGGESVDETLGPCGDSEVDTVGCSQGDRLVVRSDDRRQVRALGVGERPDLVDEERTPSR